jgi:hypothetical protein
VPERISVGAEVVDGLAQQSRELSDRAAGQGDEIILGIEPPACVLQRADAAMRIRRAEITIAVTASGDDGLKSRQARILEGFEQFSLHGCAAVSSLHASHETAKRAAPP